MLNQDNKYTDTTRYKISNGKIYFANEDVTKAYYDARVKLDFWDNFKIHLTKKCFQLKGVETLSEYWKFKIMYYSIIIGSLILIGIFAFINDPYSFSYHNAFIRGIFNILGIVILLLFYGFIIWGLIANITAAVRRAHDLNYNAAVVLLLIIFIPIVNIILLLVLLIKGTDYKDNAYAVEDEALNEKL